MSTQVPEPGALRCPRCSAEVPPDQDWCLECGHAARTRLAPPPSWRRPTAALAIVVAIALTGLVFAFVRLTDDETTAPVGVTGTTGATGVALPAPVPAPAPAPAPAPSTTGAGAPAPSTSGSTGLSGAVGAPIGK